MMFFKSFGPFLHLFQNSKVRRFSTDNRNAMFRILLESSKRAACMC